MTQTERRLYLISELLKEQPRYEGMKIPESEDGQKRLLRSLFNIRMPRTASQEFLAVQDAYLQEETRHQGNHRSCQSTASAGGDLSLARGYYDPAL